MFRRHVHALLIIVVALAVFVPTLGWGLPSRATDKYLFGERRPWTGEEILRLVERRETGDGRADAESPVSRLPSLVSLGADVDADPILDRSRPAVLNDTDAKRAAIVQRYRLMSGQPDEFIQFKALAEMAGRTGLARFDPRLYQYGGLWIYPVGALVRTSMLVGLIDSPPPGANAKAFYLDHPEVFGKFYVVARAYSTLWGCVAALAVAWIARRATGNRWLGFLAAVCFIALPVTRTAAHEAKPHLAGAVLCLLSVIAATRYVETGRRRWLLVSGALCGAAMGMVMSMLLSVAVLPAAVWLRRKTAPPPGTPGGGRGEGVERTSDASRSVPPPSPFPAYRERGLVSLLSSVACAFVVYAVTNPFVLYNAAARPGILRSNLGNSTAMYGVGGSMLASAFRVAAAGVGLGLVLALVMIFVWTAIDPVRRSDRGNVRVAHRPFGRLLAVVALVLTGQFVLLAAGKPAEYARFFIVPAAAICIGVACRLVERGRVEIIAAVSICLLFASAGESDRTALPAFAASDEIARRLRESKIAAVTVNWEPGPWSCPPIDLFETRIVLVGRLAEPIVPSVFVWPTNLGTAIGEASETPEQCDWRSNRFAIRPASGEGESTERK